MPRQNLLDDPLLQLGASPLFSASLGLLAGSNPASGSADPLGGAARGFQSGIANRAALLGPAIEQQRAQQVYERNLKATIEGERRREGLIRGRPHKPPAPGPFEKAMTYKDRLVEAGAPQSVIDLAQENAESIARENRDRASSSADVVDATGRLVSKISKDTRDREVAKRAVEAETEFRDAQIAERNTIDLSERYINLITDNPELLTATGRVSSNLVTRVKAELKSIKKLTGIDTESSINEYIADPSYWGELAGANETYKRMRLTLALAEFESTREGDKMTDDDMRRFLLLQGDSPDADAVAQGMRSGYVTRMGNLKNQATGTEGLVFNEELFKDVPGFQEIMGGQEVEAQAVASTPVRNAFQQAFPQSQGVPKTVQEASAMGIATAINVEVAETLGLPSGSWVFVEDVGQVARIP